MGNKEKGANTWGLVNKRVYYLGFKPYHLLAYAGVSAFMILLLFLVAKFVGLIIGALIIIPVWSFMQKVRKKNKEGRIDYLRELMVNPKLPRYIKDDGALYKLKKDSQRNESG